MCPLWLYRVPSVVLLGLGLSLMVWLTPGPQHLPVTLDIHTMLLGMCVILVIKHPGWCSPASGWPGGLLPWTRSRAASTATSARRGPIAVG
jgi:hypothetical protein